MAATEITLSNVTGSGYMTVKGNFVTDDPGEGKKAGRVIANTNGYMYNATSLEGGQSVTVGASSDTWIINMGTQASTVDASKVTGGGTITATGAASIKGGESFEIHTGSGNDNIEAASYDTVYAGAGADTVSFSGDYEYVNLGDGANTVAATAGKGNYATIIGGKDADSVASAGQYVSITLGDGANYASVSGNDATITSGEGNDTVVLEAGARYASVDTGAGNDSIVSAAGDATIHAGIGDDTASLSGKDWTLDMGAGNDSVNLSGTGTVTLGAGQDSVTLGATADVTVADYTLADDLIQGTAPADLKKSFLTDGMVSLSASQKITVNTTNGVYAAKIGADNNTAQTYVWAAETGAFINGNLFKGGSEALTMIGNNNGDTADTLIGGTGADTIYAGEGDVVYGGTGADSIVLSSAAATIGLGNKGGADTVSNFNPEKHVILAMDTVATGLTFSTAADKALVVSSGKNGSLKLSGVKLDGTDGKKSKMLTVQNGLAGDKVQVEVLNAADTLSADAAFVSAVGTDSVGVSFDDGGAATVIDLANTEAFGDKRKYRNINAATISGSGADTLIGSRGADTLMASGTGNVTIFGGAGNDSLVDNGTGNVTFLYAASNGLDTIKGYTNNGSKTDVLSFYNDSVKSYTRVERDDDGIVFTFGDAKQKLTVQTTDKVDTAVAIQKNYGDVEYAKFGKSTEAANFTYESNVSLYYGGKGQDNKLTISSADNAKIELYKSDEFVNIKKVDASASTGELVLIGSEGNDVLTAGSGVATLFGGKGNDTLNGGYDQTTFYFDKAGGKDVINSLNASDKVMLYDTSLSDLESNKVTADGNLVFKLKNGSQLTVNSISESTAHVFQFSDGSQYQYNGTDNGKIKWQQLQ